MKDEGKSLNINVSDILVFY